MIQVIDLVKAYNKDVVLNIPELTIHKGEVFGLVGNNGAGKTTFFNLVLDLIVATKGRILNNDVDVRESENWKEFTGAFIDESFLIGYLTAEEYFNFIGSLHGLNKADLSRFLEKYRDFFNDEILAQKKFIRDFSKGNQKKVGIIASMIGNPSLVVLDEPFANLDPSSQFRLRQIIKDFARDYKTTFLISSHTLDNIAHVSSRIVILEKGVVVKDVLKSEHTLEDIESFFKPVID